jgi:hypothetical protein
VSTTPTTNHQALPGIEAWMLDAWSFPFPLALFGFHPPIFTQKWVQIGFIWVRLALFFIAKTIISHR